MLKPGVALVALLCASPPAVADAPVFLASRPHPNVHQVTCVTTR